MARIRRDKAQSTASGSWDLEQRLAKELRENRDFGQPVIDEQVFPSGKLRVTVLWDEWDRLSQEDRTSVILRAYELAGQQEERKNIALVSGLTFPEAHAVGMLPYQVIPALREDDPVTPEQCTKAMKEEGGSTLIKAEQPQLRFATREEADSAVKRLTKRLPESAPVWVITEDFSSPEMWAGQTSSGA